jgi:hypothetical protein
MWVPIDSMPDESRVWIYQSNRKLTDVEMMETENDLKIFLNQWSAHGTPLESSFQLKYNRFIILVVNQEVQTATGCSIDDSVRFIQQLEQKYQIELLDKMNVTFKSGDFIAFKTLIDFKKMAKEKAVNENTIVFNNLVNTLGEWHEYWEVPAKDSWHSRFF